MMAHTKLKKVIPKPALEIAPELRLSPNWVIATLVGAALTLAIMGILTVEPNMRFPIRQMTLLCLGLAAIFWGLNLWQRAFSRWLMLLALIGCISLAFGLFGASRLLSLLLLPPVLAVALMTWPAAILTAILETIWLLWLWQTGLTGAPVDSVSVALTIGLIWLVLGLFLAIIHPLVQLADWSYTHFERAQQKLDEIRDQKAQLAQMQEDLKLAYQTQELLNERLAALHQIAEEAHQAKAAFVAKISHEFRTPLNMILGLIDTLLEVPEAYGDSLSPRLMEVLEIVQRNSDHLAGMINDVLDLSQAEAGQLTLHREWVNLADDIENALVMVVRPLLEKKGLQFQVIIADDFPRVYCDRTRIRQVVLNLVSNAARYTETGGIIVKARKQGHDVLISVSDTGPGIAPQDLDRIFEPFAQGDQTRPDQGGSGLGLSISQQFIERHQGHIWVESELGAGSTFSFTLPITPLVPPNTKQPPQFNEDWVWHERAAWPQLPEMPSKQRIMVCDECGDLASVITRYADEVQFTESRDLPAAVQALQKHPAHMLIFNTPSADHLLSAVEQARRALPDMPIIGCAFPPKINYALEAGAVNYLVKPVRQPALAKALQTLNRPLKRILLVDDNSDIRHLFTQMLKIIDPTLAVIPAGSGTEALTILRRSIDQGNPPDLVLLDILLPDMLGWRVLREKSQDRTMRDIPVIAVSGEELVAWPTRSPILVATMGDGISVSKLLHCSRGVASLLVQSDGTPDPGPE